MATLFTAFRCLKGTFAQMIQQMNLERRIKLTVEANFVNLLEF